MTFKGDDLWKQLEVTDDRMTKRFDKGNFKGTAVDAVYNLWRVTQALGPVGFAWGWEVISQQLEHFGAGTDNPSSIHTAVVRAWFRQEDGSVRTVDHIGQTIAARMVGQGPNRRYSVDDEYAKKSVTDALSKIMLSLGASADIWMGRFDGNKYVDPQDRAAVQAANGPQQVAVNPAPVVDDLVTRGNEVIRKAPTMDKAALQLEHRFWWLPAVQGETPPIGRLKAIDRELAAKVNAQLKGRAAAIGVELERAA